MNPDLFHKLFLRDGLVIARGVLTCDEVRELEPVADRAASCATPGEPSTTLWRDAPEFRQFAFHPHVCAMAGRLLSADRIRIWMDKVSYKYPGDEGTPAHQDQSYWPIAENETIVAWIPITPVTQANGCMSYYPASQHVRTMFTEIFAGRDRGAPLQHRLHDIHPVEIVCAPGDVVFFRGTTAHMSCANRTTETRKAYTAVYFKDGCTRGSTQSHPSVDRDQIAIGRKIDGPTTPIAWPL